MAFTAGVLMLLGGTNAFAQQIQLYALIREAEVDQSRHNKLICLYATLHFYTILSRHRAALT